MIAIRLGGYEIRGLSAVELQNLVAHVGNVVVIDDGSVDDTARVLRDLEQRYSFLRVARHRSQRGIADALRTGYLHARGRVLVFYPAAFSAVCTDQLNLYDEVLDRFGPGSSIDLPGYIEKISQAEFEVWIDTLGASIPRPRPGRKFGDLPDPSFARLDSMFVKTFYISVRPEALAPRESQGEEAE